MLQDGARFKSVITSLSANPLASERQREGVERDARGGEQGEGRLLDLRRRTPRCCPTRPATRASRAGSGSSATPALCQARLARAARRRPPATRRFLRVSSLARFREGHAREAALAAVCAILFLTFLDNTIVSVALADIQSGARRQRHRAAVDRRRLHARVRRAHAHRRDARRPVRPEEGDARRRRDLLRGLRRRGARDRHEHAHRRPGRDGRRRRGLGAGDALADPPHLPGAARARAWRSASGRRCRGSRSSLGPVIGGVLVGWQGWRAVFWFGLAFAAVAFAVAAVTLTESSDPEGRQARRSRARRRAPPRSRPRRSP